MAKIARGPSSFKRANSKILTERHAQRRLDEAVKPFNDQVQRSLFVDSVEALYYQQLNKIGKPCTCTKVQIIASDAVLDAESAVGITNNTIPTRDGTNTGVSIHLKNNDLFGDSPAEKLYGDVYDVHITGHSIEKDEEDIPLALYEELGTKEGDSQFENTSMFGGLTTCGICYRGGFQPGFRAYGKQREVLTTWDIEDISGYTIRSSDTPNTIIKQGDRSSFVEFAVNVPKYFQSCTISVRNNLTILDDMLFLEEHPLTLQILRNFAGRTIPLKVYAPEFTHVVVEFDLGVEPLRINIGGESHTLDYERLEAIENFPVILPPKIHEVNVGDVLIIPKRALALKITDKEHKITADKRQLEWSVQTRLLQRVETLRHIHKGIKLR